jgi:hypothetical protein
LRPFLASPKGKLFGAHLNDRGDVALHPLSAEDLCELKQQLETDLGVMPAIGPMQPITPDAGRALAVGSRAASDRPSRPER